MVSDLVGFRFRTHWTNSVSETHELTLDDPASAAGRAKLKWPVCAPDRLRPGESRQALTERAAATFAGLARSLHEHGHGNQAVAHFVNRLVFCMFAEDVGVLPGRMFTRMLEHAHGRPEESASLVRDLFGAMSAGEAGSGSSRWLGSAAARSTTMPPWRRSRHPFAVARIVGGRIHRSPDGPGATLRGVHQGVAARPRHRRSPADHAACSTSNAARLRASLLNSTAIRWIGWPRCRYLSA